MNKRQMSTFKKLLEKRKNELLRQVVSQDDDIDELRDDQPADPIDKAGNTSSLELMIALGNDERVELAKIDSALEKMDNRAYGQCEECGKNILAARLEAVPTARLCVDCQQEREMNPGDVRADRPRRRIILNDDLPVSSEEES